MLWRGRKKLIGKQIVKMMMIEICGTYLKSRLHSCLALGRRELVTRQACRVLHHRHADANEPFDEPIIGKGDTAAALTHNLLQIRYWLRIVLHAFHPGNLQDSVKVIHLSNRTRCQMASHNPIFLEQSHGLQFIFS